MSVYIDVIFLVNVVMDFFILWVTSIFDRRKVGFINLLKGAISGGFLYCFSLFLPQVKAINFIYGLVVMFISVGITFKPSSIKIALKLLVISFIASVLVGGAFIAVFYLTNIGYNTSLAIGSLNIWYILGLTVIFYIAIKYGGGFFHSRVNNKDTYCRIEVWVGENLVEINALKDTGNFLINDDSGNKIIISEFSAMRNLLSSKDQLLYLKKLNSADIASNITGVDRCRVKLVPFSSLGAEKGLLTAMVVDGARIFDKSTVCINKVLLVIYNGSLSSNKSCNGIINPTIIEA